METIHIYHTNDIHSHFERWPRIHQLLIKQKKWHNENEHEVFLFDIGDFVDRWHPFSEGTKGKGNTKLLNDCDYTAITIGNNEGINLSYDDLDHLYDNRSFDVLVANLYKKNFTHPNWLKPYKIYVTKKGTRIGVIGLTAYFSHLYELLGWQLTDPIVELSKWIKTIEEQSDVIILLSHLGIHSDEQIAEEFPGIDVIIGGHTHHVFQEGQLMNQTLLAAAGKYGCYVGHITLEISDKKVLTQKKALLYDVDKLPAVIGEEATVSALFTKGKELLSQKVSMLREPLVSDFFHETKLSLMLVRALREWCQSDCAFLNSGILLGPLSGEVTNYHLLTICPHPINPCRVELSGDELQDVLIQTLDKKWLHQKVVGLGFRGTVMGTFVYDQIDFKENSQIVLVNGQEIMPHNRYTLAIPDMFTFGRFFPAIYHSQHKKYYLPEFLRDLLKWKLQQEYKGK